MATGPLPASDGDLPRGAGGGDADWLVSLSSGSTGRPKGALVSHRQMYERFVTQWVSLGFDTSDRFALVTPLHFGAGRSFAMSFLAAGATLCLLPPPMAPDELVRAVNECEATGVFLVPTLMRRLLSLPGRGPLFPGLRRLLISGEAFHAHEVSAFRTRLTPNLIGYYASSEGGGVSVLQPADFDAYGDTVGQAAFGVEVEIVDASGASVPAGDVGRLRYRGPGVTTRTLAEDGTPGAIEPGGWFYPGDLAAIDRAGFITLSGRATEVIVRAGVNVYPAQIESVLRGLAGVHEVAVIGVSSPSHGEDIVAYVHAEGLDADALRAWCSERLAPYKVPARFVLVDALPRTSAGKIDRRSLRTR